jgi:hypothetical protein
MKQYTYKGRIYSVVKCVKEDIPSHIERVSSYWTASNVDIEQQTKLLEDCIDNGIALQLLNDKGKVQAVIYGLWLRNDNVKSHLLWIRSKKLFTILAWYLRQHLYIRNIYFMPHNKSFIPFEFLVKIASIKSFYSHNTPLIIDLYSSSNQLMGTPIGEGLLQGTIKEI